MTHLKNNGIALAVHALLLVSFLVAFLSDSWYEFSVIIRYIISVICLLAYIVCGFFLLRPVKKNSFLSVISVIIAVMIAYICVTVHYTWDSGLGGMLLATNPALCGIVNVFSFLPDRIFEVIAFVLLFLSPLVPSLLMYSGMVLKRCVRRVKSKKEKNCGIQTA